MISADDGAPGVQETQLGAVQRRKEKRKTLKKLKRKEIRKKLAILEREEEEALANDPEAQLRIRLREQEEREAAERERKAFEERERLWLQAIEEDRRKRVLEESNEEEVEISGDLGEDDDCEYVEEGPAEIIWKGNEIIVKKKKIKVSKPLINEAPISESHQSQEDDRPTSNPLPPPVPTQETLDDVAQQVPNFGTEKDKAHCPFHLKTGACRFGARCSRVHFYPDKSSTLLIKNMYTGPGLSWDHDEGLEFTEEEVERSYEEFYEDVHTEFLKFGELVNFKVCRNSSSHLRGNVYIHYKNLESSILAYNALNGRYYGGKQITCEFVTISRWKIAICGEYMKSRLKNCSRGSVCNFIHCFYNPGGDYEWANWDKPPPKYWRKRMAALFGTHDDMMHDDDLDRYDRRSGLHNKASPSSSSSSRDDPDETRDLQRNRRRRSDYTTKWERSSERSRSHYDDDDGSSASRYSHDSSGEILKGERDRVSSSSGVERTKKRGHLDADNNGRQTRKHRRREKIPTEKTKKHRDNHGRRKLDRSSDHGQIIGDGYHRNRN